MFCQVPYSIFNILNEDFHRENLHSLRQRDLTMLEPLKVDVVLKAIMD